MFVYIILLILPISCSVVFALAVDCSACLFFMTIFACSSPGENSALTLTDMMIILILIIYTYNHIKPWEEGKKVGGLVLLLFY